MMAQVSFTVLLTWVLFAKCALDSMEDSWNKEVQYSLGNNIRRGCGWQLSPGYDIPEGTSDKFLVSKHYPSKAEIDKYQKLPSTLTKANANFFKISHYTNYYNWSLETESQWQQIYDHPSQNRTFCYGVSKLAGQEGVLDLYDHFKTPRRGFYLLRKRNGMVTQHGAVGFECGYYQGREGCETRWNDNMRDWYDKCSRMLKENRATWSAAFSNPNNTVDIQAKNNSVNTLVNCTTLWETYEEQWKELDKSLLFKPHFYKRVFVIATQWDFNYHHFIADSLVRVMRNLKFLRANPDVYIHIRSQEMYDTVPMRSLTFKRNVKAMRDKLFTLLGIDPSRIIWDIIFAEEVYIPRCVQCGYALSSAMEMRLLSRELLRGAEHAATPQQILKIAQSKKGKDGGRKMNLIIQQRYSEVDTDRSWQNSTFEEVVTEFTMMFPEHNIVRISSLTANENHCLACEIREFSHADVLVGLHGAGLTNMMFMPPGSLVVEFVGHFVNVNMPVCGYYGPFAAIYGHHHYLHGYNYDTSEPRQADQAARRAAELYRVIKNNERETLNITTVPYYPYKFVE